MSEAVFDIYHPDLDIRAGDHLEVEFSGKKFNLVWTDVSPDDPDWETLIPWFDPKENPEMGKAAAEDMDVIGDSVGIDFWITAASNKSEDMMGYLSGDLITLNRSRDPKKAFAELRFYQAECFPVTSLDEPWHMFPRNLLDVRKIREAYAAGKKIGIADDVLSLGGTLSAIREVLAKILGLTMTPEELEIEFPAILSMYETEYGDSPPSPPEGAHPVIVAPVIRTRRAA